MRHRLLVFIPTFVGVYVIGCVLNWLLIAYSWVPGITVWGMLRTYCTDYIAAKLIAAGIIAAVAALLNRRRANRAKAAAD